MIGCVSRLYYVFSLSDAKGVPLAYVHCRDDLHGIDFDT